jgi:hypothetical protein
MFAFKENEQDISFITIDYCFILLIPYIFLHKWDFLAEEDKIE